MSAEELRKMAAKMDGFVDGHRVGYQTGRVHAFIDTLVVYIPVGVGFGAVIVWFWL